MAYSKQETPIEKIMVKRIEEQKETRTKNLYIFGLSLDEEQEKEFNKKLKNNINTLNQI